jgi:hypothetical protein
MALTLTRSRTAMEREQASRDDREARDGGQARGSVARDLVDHAMIIVRDELKIARLEARRYAAHLRRDAAPRAAYLVVATFLGALAALGLSIAAFLGIARAIGSVPWTFAIFGAFFALAAAIVAALARQPPRRGEAGPSS